MKITKQQLDSLVIKVLKEGSMSFEDSLSNMSIGEKKEYERARRQIGKLIERNEDSTSFASSISNHQSRYGRLEDFFKFYENEIVLDVPMFLKAFGERITFRFLVKVRDINNKPPVWELKTQYDGGKVETYRGRGLIEVWPPAKEAFNNWYKSKVESGLLK